MKITRPPSSYSQTYLRYKATIMRYKETHREEIREYIREYQRKLRKNPVKMQDMRDRNNLRFYISGKVRTSLRTQTLLNCSREDLMKREGITTEADWTDYVSRHDIDHIVPLSWFSGRNAHLKKYHWRHYNLQFVAETENHAKLDYVDETDPRIALIIAKMRYEWSLSQSMDAGADLTESRKYGRLINKYQKQVEQMFGNN